MTEQELSSLTEAILEMAGNRHSLGLMEVEAGEGRDKITLRQLAGLHLTNAQPIAGEEIRDLREQACLSQAAFARFLNLTTGYVSQLERGVKTPSGPALALLNVLRRKGIGAIH